MLIKQKNLLPLLQSNTNHTLLIFTDLCRNNLTITLAKLSSFHTKITEQSNKKSVVITIAIEALKVLLFVLPTRARPIRGGFPGREEMYSSQVTLEGGGGGNDCLLSI